jgi:LuxR family maltose regulon positive regulatory protein
MNQAEIIQVRLWLRRAELDSAVRWAESRALAASKAPASENEVAEALALVRVWIGQQLMQPGSAAGKLQVSTALLDGLLSASRAAGHVASAIEVCVLKALVLHGLGHAAEALASLESAFQLAGSEEFFRVFVDEGEPMKGLLQAARGRLKGSSLVYASRLLSAFQPDAEKGGQQALVEPLTEREIEILQFLEKGLSNPEIAAKLVLAEGTVKAHVANILRKLDVHNRTQAVTLARDLGILS